MVELPKPTIKNVMKLICIVLLVLSTLYGFQGTSNISAGTGMLALLIFVISTFIKDE